MSRVTVEPWPSSGRRELFAWSESADQLLGQLQSFVRHRADDPALVLVIWGKTATEAEIEGVLNARHKHAAAVALFNARLDLWS